MLEVKCLSILVILLHGFPGYLQVSTDVLLTIFFILIVQSPKLKDMYERPRESTDDLDSEDEKMDIRKILKEIEYLGKHL